MAFILDYLKTKFATVSLGELTIEKISVGGDDTFRFYVTPNIGSVSVDTKNGIGLITIPNVQPGNYKIVEIHKSGWFTNRVEPISVTIKAGSNEKVNFVNTKAGKIQIIKESIGGDGNFQFYINPSIGIVDLSTTNGTGSTLLPNIVPGDYNVTEYYKNGWISGSTGPVSITVEPGKTADIFIVNEKSAILTLTVEIQSYEGIDGTFYFDIQGPSPIKLSINTKLGTGSTTREFKQGIYQIEEIPQEGWEILTDNPYENLQLKAGRQEVVFLNRRST